MKTHAKTLTSSALVVAGLLSGSRQALATQPLQAFIERAQTQSFDAREGVATTTQREAEADASLGRILPAFSARGVYTRNQYEAVATLPSMPPVKLVIQRQNQLDGFLQLDVPIVDISSYHRYKSQSVVARATREQQAVTSLMVTRAVAQMYFQFLGASGLVRSAALSVKAAEDNLHNVDVRLEAGVATAFDHERALANVELARQTLADTELGRDLVARQLETLSGLAPLPAEDFPADDLHEEAPLERWQALANETPQMRAARSAEEAASEAQKSASTALYPTLAGSAQEHFTNAQGFTGKNAFYTLQLVASFRLDYATLANQRAQESAAAVQRIRSERTGRSVLDSTYEAYRRVQAGIVKSRSARSQAAAATRAADLATERYNAGVATQLDVTQAQRDAFLADANRISADADLTFQRAALRLAVGQSTTTAGNP